MIIKRIIKEIWEAIADFEKKNEEEEKSLRDVIEQQQHTIEKQRDLIDRQDAENKRLKDALKPFVS